MATRTQSDPTPPHFRSLRSLRSLRPISDSQTFTDSEFSATLHSWGFGSGPRHAVRGETLKAMQFWLPLLAAAICSYAGSRLAAAVRTRYEKGDTLAQTQGVPK